MKYMVISKLFITTLMALSNQACANHLDEQQDCLVQSILNTPFTAVVTNTQVTKLTSNPDEGDIYLLNADVQEIITGKTETNISYRIFVEFGEDVLVNNEPVIISLCEDDDGYYWPGVGAEFPVTAALLTLAHQAAKTKIMSNLNNASSHCD